MDTSNYDARKQQLNDIMYNHIQECGYIVFDAGNLVLPLNYCGEVGYEEIREISTDEFWDNHVVFVLTFRNGETIDCQFDEFSNAEMEAIMRACEVDIPPLPA